MRRITQLEDKVADSRFETVHERKVRLREPSSEKAAHREVFLGCGEMKDVTI